jgi:hypothetical protein
VLRHDKDENRRAHPSSGKRDKSEAAGILAGPGGTSEENQAIEVAGYPKMEGVPTFMFWRKMELSCTRKEW